MVAKELATIIFYTRVCSVSIARPFLQGNNRYDDGGNVDQHDTFQQGRGDLLAEEHLRVGAHYACHHDLQID